ncbi:hypothetical protein VOLCADRAFT_66589, partial [Volvox carteri f. nagariensis]
QWTIRKSDGSMTPIASGYEPPKTDDLGQPVSPGALVTIPCYIDALGVCNPVPGYSTIVLSAQPLLLRDTERISQRLLVILMDYSSCGFPPLNENYVRSLFLGPKGDGSGGIAKQFTQCSYGKFDLNATALKVLIVESACPLLPPSECSFYNTTVAGDDGARKLLGNAVFASFTHKTYILPPGRSCGPAAGMAYLPGTQTMLMSSSYGVERVATFMQEAMHNYGLFHSWQNGLEYEDYSTPMGRGDACFTAPELAYLGWATPAPGGDRIDSNRLRVGTNLTFELPATYLSPDGNYLRVVPDWLPSYSIKTLAKNLYIAVRVNKAGDVYLGSFYANKVNVHELNASLDNNPSTNIYSPRKMAFVSAIPPRSQVDLTTYKLVVYGGVWVGGTDILRVHLCRYNSTPEECPSMDVLESPLPPFPPPPSMPSPPTPKPPRPSPLTPKPPRPSPLTPKPPRPSPQPPASPRQPPSPRPQARSPPPTRKVGQGRLQMHASMLHHLCLSVPSMAAGHMTGWA